MTDAEIALTIVSSVLTFIWIVVLAITIIPGSRYEESRNAWREQSLAVRAGNYDRGAEWRRKYDRR